MKVYFASDHAGFELKNELLSVVRDELQFEVEDCGAQVFDEGDDYPQIIAEAARKLSGDIREGVDSRAIVLGASGQGEAIVANKFKGIRAVVFYGGARRGQRDEEGQKLDIIASTRAHNDANVLSLGARFISAEEAKEAVRSWLIEPFSGEDRHQRRINEIARLEERE